MKKKVFSITAALVALVFILSSGGFSSAGAKGVGQVITATDPGKIPSAATSRADTLIVGSAAWQGEFNPIYAGTVYDSWATSLVFDNAGLMNNDAAGNPICWMAKDYSISKDGKTFTFHIRPGIKFSNGDPVTAKDFAAVYTGIADPKYDGLRTDAVENLVGYEEYHKGYAKELKGVKVIDDSTIQFVEKTVKATALLQDFLYQPIDTNVYKFTKGNVGDMKKLYNSAMGAGPYKLVENKPSQYISFVKNENYWRGNPKIQKIIMKKVDSSNQIQELKTGGVDLDGTVPTKPDRIDLLKDAGFINLYLYPSNGYTYMGLNTRLPKFSDIRVRQALMYGLNRQGFVNAYFKGYGQVCNAPVSTVSWAYTNKVNQYSYDPKKAAALLDAAGWKVGSDGFRYKNNEKFTIDYMTSSGNAYQDMLIPIMKENYKAIGIDLVPELMEFSTLCDKVYKYRKFEAYSMAWSLSIDPDPSGIFGKSQDIPGGSNSVGWWPKKSEDLIKAGLTETNQQKRKDIYAQWLVLVNNEIPYVFLSQGNTMYAGSARVKGVNVGPYMDWTYDCENLELVK